MAAEDSETLVATVLSKQYCLHSINNFIENNKRFKDYCWYWYKCPQFKLNIKNQPTCVLYCEDCVNDLWAAVAMLYELSIHQSELEIRIQIKENKSSFILIEAANYLESWMNDFDEENSSVILNNGDFYFQTISTDTDFFSVPVKLNEKINKCIVERLSKTDLNNFICFDCTVPIEMAASIHRNQCLLTSIVHKSIDGLGQAIKKKDSVRYRIKMNKLLFSKMFWKCKELSRIQDFLSFGFYALDKTKRDDNQFIVTEDELESFRRNYKEQYPELVDLDLSWMTVKEENYRTVDLSSVDVALNDFFAERGGGESGAELPWEMEKKCRPLEIDGNEIIGKLSSINFISTDDSSEEESSDNDDIINNNRGFLKMDDIVQSTEGQFSPMTPLLSLLGIGLENNQQQ